ncbi:hypothetical protein SeLEV6574_g01069 [Synchytrium endobioticum]|uniref:Uncharacterized protein n=1 Tax=Synchytrium endobioticum TaxID=286115 RepID=A0A507DEZ3_9FUNG|nr:hypothetical protein SeLEV6574_g01069 [Synchytrium endobioticum]
MRPSPVAEKLDGQLRHDQQDNPYAALVKLNSGTIFRMTCPEAPEAFRAKLVELHNIPITVHHKPKGKNEKGYNPAADGAPPPMGIAGGDPLQARFVMTEWRAELVSCNVVQDSLRDDLDAVNENPCKCHDGNSPCICAGLAKQKSRSRSGSVKSTPSPSRSTQQNSTAKSSTSPPPSTLPTATTRGLYQYSLPIPANQSGLMVYPTNPSIPYPQPYYPTQMTHPLNQYIHNTHNSSPQYAASYSPDLHPPYHYAAPAPQPYPVTGRAYAHNTPHSSTPLPQVPPLPPPPCNDPGDMEGARALMDMLSTMPPGDCARPPGSLPLPPPYYHHPALALPPPPLADAGARDSHAFRCCPAHQRFEGRLCGKKQ